MRTRPTQVPYGLASFEAVRLENRFYVDKTEFIYELESYTAPVFLRPRRFGKSLWCSTLECYYDIKRVHQFEALFGDLAIGKDPTDRKNSHLVLRFDFSKLTISQGSSVAAQFDQMIRNDVMHFKHYYSDYFLNTEFEPHHNASEVMNQLIGLIHSRHLPKLYLIIDEYDNFTNHAALKEDLTDYYQITGKGSFLQTFFKVIKAGVGQNVIKTVFITGVLAMTLDDLTSGFNIAEFITLKERFHAMLGFTQTEVEAYVDKVYAAYQYDDSHKPLLLEILKTQYDGYTFIHGEEALYNSSALNYFLREMTTNSKGRFPEITMDPQLKTNMAWLEKLTNQSKETRDLMENLMNTGEMAASGMFLSTYNAHLFFAPDFYAASLFYLGLLTRDTKTTLRIPNVCMKQVTAEHYSQIQNIHITQDPYKTIMANYLKHLDLIKLFGEFWEAYKSRIPAQAFDKMSENHIRLMFNEICYWHLNDHFIFSIEVNRPSGRSDWEMQGNPFGKFAGTHSIIEFKYQPKSSMESDRQADLVQGRKQANGYRQDVLNNYPSFHVRAFVVLVIGNESWQGEEV